MVFSPPIGLYPTSTHTIQLYSAKKEVGRIISEFEKRLRLTKKRTQDTLAEDRN